MDGRYLEPSSESPRNWTGAKKLTAQAAKIYASYPKDLFPDPEMFLRRLLEVLQRFPAEIVEKTCDPVTGIVRPYPHRSPSIGEVVTFMEELQRPALYASQYDQQSRKQLAERDRLEREGKETDPAYRAQVVNRVVGELQERGFKFRSFGEVAAKVVGQQEEDPPYDDSVSAPRAAMNGGGR